MTTEQEKLEKLLAEVAKLKAERDEALLNARKIDDEEFLRRALAREIENPDTDNLTPLGKIMRGLRKERDTAFQRGHDDALSASTSCTQCDSPSHYRPNEDEALCGDCTGDKLDELKKQVKPYLSHLGMCCRGLPSAHRPCNCGVFELMGPISDREKEKRQEHSDLGPFPNTELIDSWVNRGD